MRLSVFELLAAASLVAAQGPYSATTEGRPDPEGPEAAALVPDGVPFPNSYYPGYADSFTDGGAQFGQSSPPSYPSPWQDGSGGWAAAIAKAQTFVKKLTTAEKVNITTGVGWQGERCVGQTGSVPRLGFRSLCMQDSPLGVRLTDKNSVFPAGGTVAASWDRNVWYQRGFDMGSEHRDKGVDTQLGPVVGPIGRAPAGGRNWEGFSPDPVLSGIAVAETVKGIQDAGVMACTKHFIGNEQEHFRNTISSNIDDVTMHELYLWPFADAVKAGTASVMCSYNQINNSYASQNSYTLNKLLKNELGFQGFVMSDWSAQEAGVASALAGLDMSMPGDITFDSGTSYWGSNLTIAVLNGTVPMWRLNDMVTRIVAGWYYVDRPKHQVDINFSSWTLETKGFLNFAAGANKGVVNEHVDVRGNHGADIRDMAAKSTVLLKNKKNALPLNPLGTLLTGVFGDDSVANPNGPNACSDRGCDIGTLGEGWGSGTANYPHLVTPLHAIKAELGGEHPVQSISDNYDTKGIASLAQKSFVSLVFVNTDSGEGYITVDGNEGDRNNLTAWGNGDVLINNVADNCNNTIVVYHSPGPVLMKDWYNHPNVTGILWAGMPGQESGNSIVDVLYGHVNPGGKLPFTLGKKRQDYGTDILYENNAQAPLPPQQDFAEGKYIDYRAFDKKNVDPLYEFGFGLSYTTFKYSNIQVKKLSAPPYTPNTGMTEAAPSFGTKGTAKQFLFPDKFRKLSLYIYPFLNSTNLKKASGDSTYGNSGSIPHGAKSGKPQPKLAAGGAPGGNPRLYDGLYTVTAQIKNTGNLDGDEVPQLYVNLGGPDDPKVMLRNFDRITIPAGQTKTFKATLTRRDLSNWITDKQDWVVSKHPKTVYVGSSSRKLHLSAKLN